MGDHLPHTFWKGGLKIKATLYILSTTYKDHSSVVCIAKGSGYNPSKSPQKTKSETLESLYCWSLQKMLTSMNQWSNPAAFYRTGRGHCLRGSTHLTCQYNVQSLTSTAKGLQMEGGHEPL